MDPKTDLNKNPAKPDTKTADPTRKAEKDASSESSLKTLTESPE